jgi:hydroxypyruvate isomerase
MPRFAANLSMLFTEVPFSSASTAPRVPASEAVEFLFPMHTRRARWRPGSRAIACRLVLHNLPAGDWDAGERGIACLPDRVDEFRAGVAKGHRVRHRTGRAAAQLPGRQGAAGRQRGRLLRKTFVANLKLRRRN